MKKLHNYFKIQNGKQFPVEIIGNYVNFKIMKTDYYKKLIALAAIILPAGLSAQDEASVAIDSAPLFSDLMSTVLVACVFVVGITAVFAIYKTLDLLVRLRELKIYEKHGLDDYIREHEANQGSWWNRFSKSMTAAVPIEREDDILFDHDYDGIRELDNSLPPWWLYGFYLTIGIAIVYMVYYHVTDYGKSSREEYAIQMERAEKEVEAYLSRQANLVDENTVVMLTEEKDLAAGKEIFVSLCAACHLETGGGNATSVGPNLTDKYWLHGGSINDVFTTIKYGVPEKGMISWKSQIRPGDMQKVASYVLSLQGTNPPGAKEPQGELYEPEANVAETEETPVESESDTELQ